MAADLGQARQPGGAEPRRQTLCRGPGLRARSRRGDEVAHSRDKGRTRRCLAR